MTLNSASDTQAQKNLAKETFSEGDQEETNTVITWRRLSYCWTHTIFSGQLYSIETILSIPLESTELMSLLP